MAKKICTTENIEIVAEKIEEIALILETQAKTLRGNAKAVRNGRIHHANEAFSTICNLQTLVNINALINAIIHQGD